MIQTNNESPSVWSLDDLMAHLDTDCYLSLVEGGAIIVLLSEPESIEATMNGDDMQALIDTYGSRLVSSQGANGAVLVYGSRNEHVELVLEIPPPITH